MAETTIAKPGLLDRFTPGGKKRIEAYNRQLEALTLATAELALATAEQAFTNMLVPFMDRVKALPVNVATKIIEHDKEGVSSTGTAANTRRIVTVERLDQSTFRVVVDAADSVYDAGTLHEGQYKSSPHYRTGNGWNVERRVVDVKLADKQGKLAVEAVKLGSRHAYEVKNLNWDDENLAVEPVAVSDTVAKTKALKLAVSEFPSKSE